MHHSRGAITVITDPLVDHQTLYSNLAIAVDMKAFSALLQKLETSQFPWSPVLILPIFKLLTPLFCFVNTKSAPLFNLFFFLKSKWKILPLLVYLVYLGTFFYLRNVQSPGRQLGANSNGKQRQNYLIFSFYSLFSPTFFFPSEYKKSCSDSEKQRALENKVNHCGRMPEVDKWRKWVLAQDQLFVFLVGNFSSFGLHFYPSSSLNLSASFHSFLAPTSFFSLQALPPSARHLNPALLFVSVLFSPSSWFSSLFSGRLYCPGVAQTKQERRSIRRLLQQCSFDEPYLTKQLLRVFFFPFGPSCTQGHPSVMKNSILVLLTRKYESVTQMI